MLKNNQYSKRRTYMNIILCDDNPTFLNNFHHQLQSAVAQCDWVCRYTLYQSPLQLLSADLSDAEILFLDIDMPKLNGIATAQKLRENYPDLIIIFVTGFIQYALDGYSVSAFRYLLKDSLQSELPACIRDIKRKLYESQEAITIKGIEYSMQVRVQDILYFEGTSQRHVIMHTKHGVMECLGKLSEYETLYHRNGFLRIQRSYLVNMFHIAWIKNYHVFLSNNESLKVSERNYANVTKEYLNWKGKQM